MFMGYGLLELLPDQFFKLTVNELLDMVNARSKRHEQLVDEQLSILAWQTSHIMNSSGNFKKSIKATDLYNPESKESKENELTPVAREAKNTMIAELEKRLMGQQN